MEKSKKGAYLPFMEISKAHTYLKVLAAIILMFTPIAYAYGFFCAIAIFLLYYLVLEGLNLLFIDNYMPGPSVKEFFSRKKKVD